MNDTGVQITASLIFVNLLFAFVYMTFNYSRLLLKILPFALLIFVCLGCQTMETVESTKIPQSEITQTYTIRGTREQTEITAQFNQGNWGKSVDLDAPSKIDHNGSELPQVSNFMQGTFYESGQSGVQTNHQFIYTNNDGKTFRNEMSFQPLEITVREITISRSQETKIPLSRVVGNDEKVSISIISSEKRPESDNSNKAPEMFKKDMPEYDLSLNNELDDSRSAIILKPKNLRKFVNGKAVLTVEISRELPLQQQTQAGGTMRWSYSSTADATVTN